MSGGERSLAGLAGSYVPSTPSAWPVPAPTTIQDALDDMAGVLSNRIAGGTASGAGQTATLTLAAIKTTTGAVRVSAFGTLQSSNAADPISAQLTRDGTPIGPAVDLHTDASENAPLSIGPFVDTTTAGSHVYAVLLTNATGGHTIEFVSGYALAEEVFA